MRKELDLKLVEKYPLLYRNRYLPMTETAMCWGFCCGDGWYNIIDTLSELICSGYNQAKERYDNLVEWKNTTGNFPWPGGREITDEEIAKAKTKMEEEELKVPVASQVKEKFGTLRFYIDRGTEEHYNYIRFAEYLSARTCEICGSPGKLRGHGWLYTACDEHTEEEDLKEEQEDAIDSER
jgi:hypothetical protein